MNMQIVSPVIFFISILMWPFICNCNLYSCGLKMQVDHCGERWIGNQPFASGIFYFRWPMTYQDLKTPFFREPPLRARHANFAYHFNSSLTFLRRRLNSILAAINGEKNFRPRWSLNLIFSLGEYKPRQ